jgi:hypothetical protein
MITFMIFERPVQKRDIIAKDPGEIQLVADNESISLKRLIIYLEARTPHIGHIGESI